MQILVQGLFFALLNIDNETKHYGLFNRCLINSKHGAPKISKLSQMATNFVSS